MVEVVVDFDLVRRLGESAGSHYTPDSPFRVYTK